MSIILTLSLLRNRLPYTNDEKELWFRESSSNGMYHIVGYQIGEPFLFGSHKILIYFYANNSVGKLDDNNIVDFYTEIANDGGTLYPNNYSIEWLENSVKVVFKGNEQSDAVYIIPYKNN